MDPVRITLPPPSHEDRRKPGNGEPKTENKENRVTENGRPRTENERDYSFSVLGFPFPVTRFSSLRGSKTIRKAGRQEQQSWHFFSCVPAFLIHFF
jgi:hypothetical protein